MKISLAALSAFTLSLVLSVSSQIMYPAAGTVWKVGQSVSVSFSPSQNGETVSIFFNEDRGDALAGGPISHGGVFRFRVPPDAVSPPGGTSELLAVYRVDEYLQKVDSIDIKVDK